MHTLGKQRYLLLFRNNKVRFCTLKSSFFFTALDDYLCNVQRELDRKLHAMANIPRGRHIRDDEQVCGGLMFIRCMINDLKLATSKMFFGPFIFSLFFQGLPQKLIKFPKINSFEKSITNFMSCCSL